jgi:hypothetical protein
MTCNQKLPKASNISREVLGPPHSFQSCLISYLDDSAVLEWVLVMSSWMCQSHDLDYLLCAVQSSAIQKKKPVLEPSQHHLHREQQRRVHDVEKGGDALGLRCHQPAMA